MAKAKQTDIEDVLKTLTPPAPAAEPPVENGSSVETPQSPMAEEPTITLPPEAFAVPEVHGSFSDDPPEGWGTGVGNVSVDPVTSQLDPVAAARASLLEDAARATGGSVQPTAPTTTVPVTRRGSRVPEIRQALARAAQHPSATRYRSRVTIGAAYQYDGKLHLAPDFIDRNWAAWEDGPAINVPEVGIVKQGQWIVIQEVLDDAGAVNFTELKVYDDHVFRSLFMEADPNGS